MSRFRNTNIQFSYSITQIVSLTLKEKVRDTHDMVEVKCERSKASIYLWRKWLVSCKWFPPMVEVWPKHCCVCFPFEQSQGPIKDKLRMGIMILMNTMDIWCLNAHYEAEHIVSLKCWWWVCNEILTVWRGGNFKLKAGGCFEQMMCTKMMTATIMMIDIVIIVVKTH